MGEARAEGPQTHRPGPRRPPGAPVGPHGVRRAVLDAAAMLFSHRGVPASGIGVSSREEGHDHGERCFRG